MPIRWILILPLVLMLAPALAASAGAKNRIWWQSRDMLHCSGDSRDLITFDGAKSTVRIPGDGQPHRLSHTVQYADYAKDVFVIEFGQV